MTAASIHVLHVDDDAAFRELVSDFLMMENQQISVTTAEDAIHGYEALATHDIDCIVSDYEMPEQNGLEFFELVLEEDENLPFILFTGKGSEEIASKAISTGVTDYIQKSGGRDTYTILVNRITNAVKQYRVKQEARRAKQRLRGITDSATDAIITIDCESAIQFANPAVEDLFGYTPSELKGESLSVLMSERLWDDHRNALTQYFDTGEWSLNWKATEVFGQRKDGSEIPLSISYSEFTLEGESYFTSIIRDVSKRVRLQEQVQKRTRQLHKLGEQLRDIVWITDPTREQLLYVNPRYEEVWGQSPDGLLDDRRSFLETVHPDDRDRVERFFDTPPLDKYDVEYRVIHPQNGTRWVRERSVPIPSRENEIERVIGVAEDLTKQKLAEQRFERQLAQLSEFGNVLSHDLSAPLTILQGRIRLAQETGDTSHLEDAARAVQRVKEITDEVSKVMQNAGVADDVAELDFESEVHDVWETLQTEDASLTIEESGTIRADRSPFKRLLENLLENALEHGGASVNVRVGMFTGGFFIEDDGPGIPAEDHEDVFTPGFTAKDEGQGLGLPSVRQIVQAHGWQIELRANDGDGTRFEISNVELG
ncbi:PAS domain S-box protein [Salinigranum halophilum]|uniref:PAS domain S-box protein n=1 Tax=Salinigranum halophilum TaxID=2565931 RepID=UPI0010A7DC48|nr:PAS domain S-box protein [Salinigranum halophilum]